MSTHVLHATHPDMIIGMSTEKLREHYLMTGMFEADAIGLRYCHNERLVIGGAVPATKPLSLVPWVETGPGPFLERRELGIINIGGPGSVLTDGVLHPLGPRDGLYVGRGTLDVRFDSDSADNPARFYLVSAPAHATYPTVRIPVDGTNPMPMGGTETCNQRVIYKYIDPSVCQSAQLLMGLTSLASGSIWNTCPCHLHGRRSEIYFYFDQKDDARVFHFMGQPQETRHLVIANEEAVVSPPWSIHMGAGTSNYSFIWAMAGENQDYKDMDIQPTPFLR